MQTLGTAANHSDTKNTHSYRNTIQGTSGDDNLVGTEGSDTIQGLAGNDQINGRGGNDTLEGNQGNDVIYGGDGNDVLRGGQNNDKLYGDAGNDQLVTGLGNDELTGGSGNDTFVISLEAGSTDMIHDFEYTNPNEKIDLSAFTSITNFSQLGITQEGADTKINLGNNQYLILKNFVASNLAPANFLGGASVDSTSNLTLNGTPGNDYLRGGLGNDQINGLDGNDYLRGNVGDDTMQGGIGNDVMRGGEGNDQMSGQDGNDELYGGTGQDNISGNVGDDVLYGGEDDDSLFGGKNNDKLFGDNGNDQIHDGLGNDELTGGSGNDTFVISLEAGSTDIIHDFEYTNLNEKIDLSAFTSITNFSQLGITQEGADTKINLGDNQYLILKNFVASNLAPANFLGGASIDSTSNLVLNGTPGSDYLRGGLGNDQINGLDGNDYLRGNVGDDNMHGGVGDDVMRGGEGNDQMFGEDGKDEMYGGAGKDTISGNVGDDILYGGEDDDSLFGGKDNDKLFGDNGNDELHGGLGNNELTGGSGNDTFVIKVNPGGTDIIKDFEINNPSELIDLSAFGNIKKFSDLKITQDGQNAIIDIGANQKLKLENINAVSLTARNFRAVWSVVRQINIYAVGNKVDRQFTSIPNSVKSDIKNYVINGFDTSNPKNSAFEKPWNKIDLSYFNLQAIELKEVDGSTVIDLGQNCSLKITGVTLDKLDTNKNFVLSTNDRETWKNEITPDWKPNDDKEVAVIKSVEDEIIHDKGIITYYSNPVALKLINKSIGFVEPNLELFRIDNTTSTLQVIENFNPENDYQLIDISQYNVKKFSDLGISVVGSDTYVNVGAGKSIVLKNTDPNKLSEDNFLGITKNDYNEYTIYSIVNKFEDTHISNFDFINDKIDLSSFENAINYSDMYIAYSSNIISIYLKQYDVAITLDNPNNQKLSRDSFVKNYPENHMASIDNIPDVKSLFAVNPAFIRIRDDEINSTTTKRETNSNKNVLKNEITLVKSNDKEEFSLGGKLLEGGLINTSLKSLEEIDSYVRENINKLPDDWATKTLKGYQKVKSIGIKSIDKILLTKDYHDQLIKERINLRNAGVPEEQIESLAQFATTIHIGGKFGLSTVAGKAGGIGGGVGGTFLCGPGCTYAGGFAGNIAASTASDAFYDKYHVGDKFKFAVLSKLLDVPITSWDDYVNYLRSETNSQPQWSEINRSNNDNPFGLSSSKFAQFYDGLSPGQSGIFEGVIYEKPLVDTSSVIKGKAVIPYPKPKQTDSSDPISLWSDFKNSLPEGSLGRFNGKLYQKIDGEMYLLTTDNDIDATQVYNSNLDETLPSEPSIPKITSVVVDLQKLLTDKITEIGNALQQDFACAFNSDIDPCSSQLAGLLADVIQGKRLDEAVLAFGKSFAEKQIMNDLIKTIGVDDELGRLAGAGVIGQFSHSLALSLVTQLATGKLSLHDDLGRTISLYTASYVAQGTISSIVTPGITTFIASTQTAQQFAQLLGLASAGFPIVGQVVAIIAVSVLMKEFGPQIIEAWDKIADIGEDTWDFIRDPINGVEDLWKNIKDDKWTYRTGTDIADVMYSDSEWENIKTGKGDDVVISYNGWNKIFGEDGNDILFGGDGTLTTNGYIRPDEIFGGPGNDYINGREANDDLIGNSGDDWIIGGPGDDKIFGDDRPLDLSGSGDVVVTSPDGVNDGDDVLYGNQGNDIIYAGGGNDRLYGGKDNDELYGGPGNDILAGGSGSDRLDGGTGTDNIDYSGSDGAVNINLKDKTASGGHAEGDTFVNVEGITGSVYDDILTGDDGSNNIYGNDGNDKIYGNGGNDILQGNKGDDEIYGNRGNDLIYGGQGNDTLYGGKDNDVIYGDLGDNILNGDDGNDVLISQKGNDTQTGGAGNDVFYAGKDIGEVIITDFNPSEDTINLSEWNTGDVSSTIMLQSNGQDTIIKLSDTQRVIVQNKQPRDILSAVSFDRITVTVSEDNSPTVNSVSPSVVPSIVQESTLTVQPTIQTQQTTGYQSTRLLSPTQQITSNQLTSQTPTSEGTTYQSTSVPPTQSSTMSQPISQSPTQSMTGQQSTSQTPTQSSTNQQSTPESSIHHDTTSQLISQTPMQNVDTSTSTSSITPTPKPTGQSTSSASFLSSPLSFINNWFTRSQEKSMVDDQINSNMFGEDGSDKLYGGPGKDTISGKVGNDILYGGEDDDSLFGGKDNDKLFGEDDDYLMNGHREDKIHGESTDLLLEPFGYKCEDVEFMSDNRQLEPNRVYVRLNKEDELVYSVVLPTGETLKDIPLKKWHIDSSLGFYDSVIQNKEKIMSDIGCGDVIFGVYNGDDTLRGSNCDMPLLFGMGEFSEETTRSEHSHSGILDNIDTEMAVNDDHTSVTSSIDAPVISQTVTSSGNQLSPPFSFIGSWFSGTAKTTLPQLGTETIKNAQSEKQKPITVTHAPDLNQQLLVARFLIGGLEKLSEWWYSEKETPEPQTFIPPNDQNIQLEINQLKAYLKRAEKRMLEFDDKLLQENTEWATFSLSDFKDDLNELESLLKSGKLTQDSFKEAKSDIRYFCREVKQTWEKQQLLLEEKTPRVSKNEVSFTKNMRKDGLFTLPSQPMQPKQTPLLLETPMTENNSSVIDFSDDFKLN